MSVSSIKMFIALLPPRIDALEQRVVFAANQLDCFH